MAIKVTHTKPEFKDERGYITRFVNNDPNLRSVIYITSKKGTVRANHYHKKDTHYVYVVSGSFEYFEKDLTKKNSKLQSVVLKPGDLVYTKPMIAHAMKFLEDTVFMAFTSEGRDQNKYEDDTVRVDLI